MAKYKFTYFLNTACAERRPQTRRDLIEDWIVEEREYPLDLEAFEYAFINILDGDEDELDDIYEELPDQDDLTKINRLKEIFDEEAGDPGMGNTILISLEGPGQTYDSGYTKEDFNTDFEDDEEYDDEEYLDENKLINKTNKFESTDYSNTVPANVIRNIDDMLSNGNYPGAKWKISNVYSQLSIFDWWPEYISPTRLNQMRKFLQDAMSIGCDKYCCFKVGASGCANGMWASDKATTDGYSPKGGKTLYRSFTPDYTYYDIDLGDGFTQQKFKSFRDVKNYIAEQEKLKSQDNEINTEDINKDENKKLNEDYEDNYDLHEAAMECVWEGFDFAQEEFIDNSIKNEEDYKNKVRTQSEDYEDIKDDYLNLEDFYEDEILEELYKIITKQVSEDFEITKHIAIEDDGEECPYISGWCDESINIYNRNDLSEDELWATGWVGSVQNLSEGPFDSYEDIIISCFDNEKGSEYNLPDIPEDIQKEFVVKVNKWIEENPDELNESKKLNETIDLKPDGGDKKNWFAFYTGLQGGSYSNNTQDNIAQFGKENLEGLKDLSIEEIKDSHMYWGSEYGFHSFYNGDTFILFDDIEKLPEDMKKDAYECCKCYKKIKKEDTQLEIDEKGLPVLEKPYSLSKRNDNKFQITSSHPYDETDYSYAISKTDDINGIWNVYDKDPNYVINSNKSAFMKIGVANDWNEALEFMKKLDSEKKPKIDRT